MGDLRGVRPGRRVHDAPLRRHRPRSHHLVTARRDDGRPSLAREPARGRQSVPLRRTARRPRARRRHPTAPARFSDDSRAGRRRPRDQPADPRRDPRELADDGGRRGDRRRGARRATGRSGRGPALSSGADRCADARRRWLRARRGDCGGRSAQRGQDRAADVGGIAGAPGTAGRDIRGDADQAGQAVGTARCDRHGVRGTGRRGPARACETGAPVAATRARPADTGGRGQSHQPEAGLGPARTAGAPRLDRRQRAPGGGTRGAGAVRPHRDGRADAGDERARGHRGHSPGRAAHGPSYPDRGPHRPRDGRRPRTMPGRRHGRLRLEAGPGGRAVLGHRCDRRCARARSAVSAGATLIAGAEDPRLS